MEGMNIKALQHTYGDIPAFMVLEGKQIIKKTVGTSSGYWNGIHMKGIAHPKRRNLTKLFGG